MNPRNMEGYGLSDGEVVERLWSYLRRFSTMTKEMRPAHRIDVLIHGLSYYGRCAAEHIGKVLMHNFMTNFYKKHLYIHMYLLRVVAVQTNGQCS